MPPFGATTLMSKFTRRSPEMVPLLAPMPCAVWQTEQEKPVLMCEAVLVPAGVRHHVVEIVALGAHRVRAVDAEVGVGE